MQKHITLIFVATQCEHYFGFPMNPSRNDVAYSQYQCECMITLREDQGVTLTLVLGDGAGEDDGHPSVRGGGLVLRGADPGR